MGNDERIDRFDGGMPTPAAIFHGDDEDRFVVYHFDENGSFMLTSLKNEQMIKDKVAALGQDITTLRREEIDGQMLCVEGLIAASQKRKQ